MPPPTPGAAALLRALHWPLRAVWLAGVLGDELRAQAGERTIGPRPRSPDAPVLQEPRVQDFYAHLHEYSEVPFAQFDAGRGPPIVRVRDLDDATFQQLVRDGTPFVVDDCARGFDIDAVSNFECKDFADRWPTGNMRAEYTPGQYHIYLRDPHWYTEVAPQRANKEHMAKEKKIAGPYIWHVKDEEPLKTKREVQQHWRTPYFLDRSFTNRMEANESFEFWFSMAGGGTFSHADAYCETTISLQFKGTKRWRVQAFPPVVHYLNATAYHDEQIYDSKTHVSWTPETEFAVGPGQCFIFPTGYLHETYVDPAGNDGGCFTASTFQFNHPRQVNLYRAYLSRLSMSHYGMSEPCFSQVESYATLLGTARLHGAADTGEPDRASARAEAERLLRLIDGESGDGRISRDELYAHFCVGPAKRRRVMQAGRFTYPWVGQLTPAGLREFEEESMNVWAEDALQYHDIDKDKAISLDELAHSFLQWAVVQYRMAKVRSAGKTGGPGKWTKQVVASEVDILRNYYCEDPANCPEADDLAAYGQALLKRKRAAAEKMQHVIRMFESDGDEETLTMKDRDTGEENRVKVGQVRSEL